MATRSARNGRRARVGAGDGDFNIAHLFFAGIITAAGAAVFWGLKELVTKSRRQAAEDEQTEL